MNRGLRQTAVFGSGPSRIGMLGILGIVGWFTLCSVARGTSVSFSVCSATWVQSACGLLFCPESSHWFQWVCSLCPGPTPHSAASFCFSKLLVFCYFSFLLENLLDAALFSVSIFFINSLWIMFQHFVKITLKTNQVDVQ